MGLQAIQNSVNPLQQPFSLTTGAEPAARPMPKRPLFDVFEAKRTQPNTSFSTLKKLSTIALHPLLSFRLYRGMKTSARGAAEGLGNQIVMYRALQKAASLKGASSLRNLLKSGVLANNTAENGHTTLYQLYAMLTTPRATGLDGREILNETLALLDKPYQITQKFTPLSENAAKAMMQVEQNPQLAFNRARSIPVGPPVTWADLNVPNSATCVSSSVLYYMADRNPSELTRHLNELTSPMQAFYEKAKLSELSPDDPQKAYDILDAAKLTYFKSGDDEVTVKVELPITGLVRTINASKKHKPTLTRSGVEAAYQSALSYMATRRTYDPATDYRDSEIPNERSKGLTEPEKTLMETIVKDNGGVHSVTYQAVAGHNSNPEDTQSYLYGYTRSFQDVTSDLIKSLEMDEPVIIGITDTDQEGAIIGGHELTVTSADVDPKTNEIVFRVIDTDDNDPRPAVRYAREIIPRIHHAGFPLQLAKKINQDIEQVQKSGQYLIPGNEDLQYFDPIARNVNPMPANAFMTPEEQQQAAAQQQSAEQAVAATQGPEATILPAAPAPMIPGQLPAGQIPGQVIDYVPVMTWPGGVMPQPFMPQMIPQMAPQAMMPTYLPPAPYYYPLQTTAPAYLPQASYYYPSLAS